MSTDDKQATGRAPQRFLALLRDVIFEATPDVSNAPTTTNAPVAAPGAVARASEGDTEAARAALCQSLDEQAGTALREFMLQLEGLREVLADAAARRRAALRVLALKGISAQAVVLELERSLAALAAQRDAFAGKVEARRVVIERQRSDAAAARERETAEAEAALRRLQAELDTEHTKIAEANGRQAREVAACDQSSSELEAKQRGFERAFSELVTEYGALKSALVNPESS